MKYTAIKSYSIHTIESNPPKIGQWIMLDGSIKGQYLGKTNAGSIVIRWQNGKFGKLADCKSNHYLRQFAIVNGSK